MISVTYADALIACVEAKYHYAFWRPITAIRAGDTDGNEATAGDPTWSPLLPVTPNHPEYPSAHSCITPAGGVVITRFLERDRSTSPSPASPGSEIVTLTGLRTWSTTSVTPASGAVSTIAPRSRMGSRSPRRPPLRYSLIISGAHRGNSSTGSLVTIPRRPCPPAAPSSREAWILNRSKLTPDGAVWGAHAHRCRMASRHLSSRATCAGCQGRLVRVNKPSDSRRDAIRRRESP